MSSYEHFPSTAVDYRMNNSNDKNNNNSLLQQKLNQHTLTDTDIDTDITCTETHHKNSNSYVIYFSNHIMFVSMVYLVLFGRRRHLLPYCPSTQMCAITHTQAEFTYALRLIGCLFVCLPAFICALAPRLAFDHLISLQCI